MGLAVVLDDEGATPGCAEPPTTTLNPVGMGKLEWPLTVLCPSPPSTVQPSSITPTGRP